MPSFHRIWFLGAASAALVACANTCQSESTLTSVDASADAQARAQTTLGATDAGDAGAGAELTKFASKEDFTGYLKKVVQDEEDARNRDATHRLALLEAGVADEAGLEGNLWGDQIGDSFGAGGLGLSGTGVGGGGIGSGVGLGSIGSGGAGTGSGYGAGRGRAIGAAGASTSITNTQVAGVDEGDIVKAVGDYLVVLRRGRLFTVKVGADSLAPGSTVDAFAPDVDPRDTWYDEMLVSNGTIVVIGYSYKRGGTEIGLFDLDDHGGIKYRATYHLRASDYYSSRNYASRLVGDKLVFYSPTTLAASAKDPLARFPALRKWKADAVDSAFTAVLEPTEIYKPLVPQTFMTLHSVTVCSLGSPELQCTSRGVLGPSGRVFYVSQDSVYVWTTPYTRYWAKKKAPDGGRLGSDAGVERSLARSYLYRLPLDGAAPSVVRASGSPIDQFSFHQTDGHLNVLVREDGNGDSMWAAEGSSNGVAMLRLPLTSFGKAATVAPGSAYTSLPGVAGNAFQNRFVGDFVLYGTGAGWGRRPHEPVDRKITAYRFASQASETAQVLPLDHFVDRIEPIGHDALVVGSRDNDLVFSAISLGGKAAEARGSYVRKNASQGETRSHGFFYKPESDTSGTFALPIRGGEEIGANQLVSGSAQIAFVKNDALVFKELGSLAARAGASANDGCRASCVDWYGNARPIFLGDRVLAMLGYELVEAKLENGQIRERRRTSFSPRAK